MVNVPGDPQELYEDFYCQRGEMENRIKEQQLGLFADRTSCHRFLANQFRLLLSSAAYVLVQALRRTACSWQHGSREGPCRDDPVEVAQGGGAEWSWPPRRVVFHLATSYPFQDLVVPRGV